MDWMLILMGGRLLYWRYASGLAPALHPFSWPIQRPARDLESFNANTLRKKLPRTLFHCMTLMGENR